MNRLLYAIFIAGLLAGCSEPTVRRASREGATPNEPVMVASADKSILPTVQISEPNGLLTLRDALGLTLLHNPELRAYSYEIRAAEARHLQAGLRKNPVLDIEVENFGGSGEFREFDSAETTIQLGQIIELGGQINKRKRAFAYGSRLAEIDFAAKQLELSSELTRLFITQLLIQDKEALSAELVQISQEIHNSVQKRVDAGKDSPIELSKATVGLARAKLQQLEVVKYREVTRSRLAAYWGSDRPAFTKAAGRLDEVDALPACEDVRGFLDSNPELMRRAVEVQQRKAQMALADAQGVGNVKVAGGVKYFNGPDETAYIVGLSIPLSVSDRNQGGRAEAVQQYRKAQQLQQVSELSVRNEVDRLLADLQAAYARVTILRDDVMAAAASMFAASKVAYEQGKSSYLELLDAQKMYFGTKNDYINSLADYHIAKTELERLIGQRLNSIEK